MVSDLLAEMELPHSGIVQFDILQTDHQKSIRNEQKSAAARAKHEQESKRIRKRSTRDSSIHIISSIQDIFNSINNRQNRSEVSRKPNWSS